MTKTGLLVKYGEIFLRGGNRYFFEKLLISNILQAVGRMYYVRKEQGRFLITRADGSSFDAYLLAESVKKVFGVTAVCPCTISYDGDIDTLKRLSLEHIIAAVRDGKRTFKVDATRTDKTYPLTSHEINCAIGDYIIDETGLTVDLHNPDIILRVELRTHTYLYSNLIKAEGGLPVSSSGNAVLLLSGGIDSPVAGYLASKRGIKVTSVYFHSPPHTSERALMKVQDLAATLAKYNCGMTLYVVNFTPIQMMLNDRVPLKKLTLFLKRAMIKTALRIGEKVNAQALFLGDSVGQVASQTLQSMASIDSASSLPLLRPLCGYDKQEIIDIARRIGTFDISIRPYDDCCTLFVSDNPETKPKKSVIETMEAKIIELDSMIGEAVQCITAYEYNGNGELIEHND